MLKKTWRVCTSRTSPQEASRGEIHTQSRTAELPQCCAPRQQTALQHRSPSLLIVFWVASYHNCLARYFLLFVSVTAQEICNHLKSTNLSSFQNSSQPLLKTWQKARHRWTSIRKASMHGRWLCLLKTTSKRAETVQRDSSDGRLHSGFAGEVIEYDTTNSTIERNI